MASLLLCDFPYLNGALIFQKLCSMAHLTDQILKQVYELSQNQINLLKNSRVLITEGSHNTLNDFKQTAFYRIRMKDLRTLLAPHIPYLESLKQSAIKSNFKWIDNSMTVKENNIDEILNDLAASISHYPFRVKDKRQSDRATENQQRRQQQDTHYQKFLQEMQQDDQSDYPQQDSQLSNYELPLKRLSNKQTLKNDSPSKAQDDLTSKRRRQLRDLFPSMQHHDIVKRKRQDRSNESARQKPHPVHSRQNIVPRLKKRDEYSSGAAVVGRQIGGRESKSAKGQWGKIIDYFSQDTQSTQISGQRNHQSEERNNGLMVGGKKPQNKPAPSLDSLFYKKKDPSGGPPQGSLQQKQAQTSLKDSSFKKRIYGLISGEDLEISKRMMSFDLQQTLSRFQLDKPFKAHIQHQIMKIQSLIGKTQVLCSPGETEFYFDEQKYVLNELSSIIKAFRVYREVLQQFSLYASNNKIDKINFSFNLFWFLVTNALQIIIDEKMKQDIIIKIREELQYLLNQFNIIDFMSIKSFEYQTNILLHIIMIANLIYQELPVQKREDDNDLTKCSLLYMIQWVLMTLLTQAFSSSQGLENARQLMKKELTDCFIIFHLLYKAFGSENNLWDKLIAESMALIFKNSLSKSGLLTADQENKQQLSFSEWRKKQVSLIQFDSKFTIQSLDISLFSYNLAILCLDLTTSDFRINWSNISSLLQDHISLSLSSSSENPLSVIALKMLSNLMSYNANAQLSHETFLIIYQSYLKVVSSSQQAKVMRTLKQQRDSLKSVSEDLFKRYCVQQESKTFEKGGSNAEEYGGLLESYLKTQDQRQIKQLYQKIVGLKHVQSDSKIYFNILMTFVGQIQSERQAFMVMKKALLLAHQEAEKEDTFEIAKIVIKLGGHSQKFKGTEELIDKSDIISCILTLLKRILTFFIQKVLKNKGNLNQNEYLIKIETYLLHLSSSLKFLSNFASSSLKGKWRQHEYRWLSDPQLLTDDIFSLYSYLSVKSPELESLQGDYLRLIKAFLSKRRSSVQQKQNQDSNKDEINGSFQTNLEQISMSSSLEGADELIAECLIYEEQDQLLVKELLKGTLRNSIERSLKSYMTVGRDIRVLIKLFEVSGLIDGLLIENGEIKPIQVLQKVQATKYGSVNDSIDQFQKPMVTALCINTYLQSLVSRCGISKLCGFEALQISKNDSTQRDLLIQISYNFLENLIRALIIYQKPISFQQSVFSQVYAQPLKLYQSLREYFKSEQQSNQLLFKDQNTENLVLKAFTKCQIVKLDYKTNVQTFDTIIRIFSSFLKEISQLWQQPDLNKQVMMSTVNMYVALVPILCKQFQELQAQNKGEFKSYLNFLKSILISYMVNFQHLSQNHQPTAQFISQIINLVMPTFFSSSLKPTQQLDSLENQDSFYFYQYLSLQFQQTPDDPRLASNMRHFLDLCLKTIESNLNTLIPSLFLLQVAGLESTFTQIKNDQPVLKNLLDSIGDQIFKDAGSDEFLMSLLQNGYAYLQTPVVTQNWQTQDHQYILKAQRRILSLVILSMLLYPRLLGKSKVPQKFFNQLLITLVAEWVDYITIIQKQHSTSSISATENSLSNNLNVLAILRAGKMMKGGKVIGRYVTLILDEIVRQEMTRNEDTTRAEVMRMKIRDQVRKMMRAGVCSSKSQFLIKSAHQFIMSDTNLIPNLIVSISLQILGDVKIDQNCSSLLRFIHTNQLSSSKMNSSIVDKIEGIILTQQEYISKTKCPDKFKSLNHLLL